MKEAEKVIEILEALNACNEAMDWVREVKPKTLWEVIEKCKRSDWQEWLLYEIVPDVDENLLRMYGVRCVRETPLKDGRKVFDVLTDECSINALDVAECFANGIATDEDLAAVWDAARAAALTAAGAAVGAAARAAALTAARDAARAAAGAARAAAWDATWDAAWAAQSEIFVEIFSVHKETINSEALAVKNYLKLKQ